MNRIDFLWPDVTLVNGAVIILARGLRPLPHPPLRVSRLEGGGGMNIQRTQRWRQWQANPLRCFVTHCLRRTVLFQAGDPGFMNNLLLLILSGLDLFWVAFEMNVRRVLEARTRRSGEEQQRWKRRGNKGINCVRTEVCRQFVEPCVHKPFRPVREMGLHVTVTQLFLLGFVILL